jgi:ubiquinone/menaquinone biosynthesis C-methylase UbiE
VLEHVHDPDESLEEIKRVLRPGGTLYVFKLPNRYSYLERIARWIGLYYHGAEPNDRIYTKRTAYELIRSHGFQIKEFRRTNLLPLTLTGRWAEEAAGAIWLVNRALSRIPGLNLLATNLELVTISPP